MKYMRVLMITQKVDARDDILGFTVDWIDELAKEVDAVDVLTGFRGEYNLYDNTEIHSYGKEKNYPKLVRVLRFETLSASLIHRADVVFVHMVPSYVLAISPLLRITGTPCILWYAHGSVNWRLRMAHSIVDRIVTATDDSFRIDSNKVRTVGHGIDTRRFTPCSEKIDRSRLLSLGRVDPIKNIGVLIKAVGELVNEGYDVTLRVVGKPTNNLRHYKMLQEKVSELNLNDNVEFAGSIPHHAVVDEYRKAGVFLSASGTGSLDKVEVEAMACGTPVISSNDSYKKIIRASELDENSLCFNFNGISNPSRNLMDKIRNILNMNDREYMKISAVSRSIACCDHDLSQLMKRISEILEDVQE